MLKVTQGEKRDRTVNFEDLGEGETFKVGDDAQIQIKTDEDGGCCLEDGMITSYDGDDEVVRVDCEVIVH